MPDFTATGKTTLWTGMDSERTTIAVIDLAGAQAFTLLISVDKNSGCGTVRILHGVEKTCTSIVFDDQTVVNIYDKEHLRQRRE